MTNANQLVRRLAPIAAGTTAVLLALPAGAAVITPLGMGMKATSSSCITDCLLNSNHTTDSDSDDTPSLSFGDLSVGTAVAAGSNSFPASAGGTTTITSDTSFVVHLLASRPAVTFEAGTYVTRSTLDFSFMTDAAGGTMEVAYAVSYARPTEGATLDTGIGFSAPFELSLFGGRSVPSTSFDSLSGTSSGTWTYDLAPETVYIVQLAANNTRAFSGAPGFGTDDLDATYTVTLPSFAQPVPEPEQWALLLAGLGLIGMAAGRRRAARAGLSWPIPLQ
jgi:hypothetical protein